MVEVLKNSRYGMDASQKYEVDLQSEDCSAMEEANTNLYLIGNRW
jgi:hypothetical protein